MANERMLNFLMTKEAVTEFEGSIRRCERAIFKSGPDDMEQANSELEKARKDLMDIIHYLCAPDYVPLDERPSKQKVASI